MFFHLKYIWNVNAIVHRWSNMGHWVRLDKTNLDVIWLLDSVLKWILIPSGLNSPPSALVTLISRRREALGMMAEKQRQKLTWEKGNNPIENGYWSGLFLLAEMNWIKLEGEYDQLKHPLAPIHEKTSMSPGSISITIYFHRFFCIFVVLERSTIPTDCSKPSLPSSVKPIDDAGKTRLIEKKQQSWKQDNCKSSLSSRKFHSFTPSFQRKKYWFGTPLVVLMLMHRIPTNLQRKLQSVILRYSSLYLFFLLSVTSFNANEFIIWWCFF